MVIATIDDALALLGVSKPKELATPDLPDPQRRLWDFLADGPAGVDRMSESTGLPLSECLASISSLEIRGLVDCLPGGQIRRI